MLACGPFLMLWAGARECALALGVGKEVFGFGVLLGVLRGSLVSDRPGPCGVHILCAAIRSTAEHQKGQCSARGADFVCAGGGRARADAGGVFFAGRARVGRVHAAEGASDAGGIGPVFCPRGRNPPPVLNSQSYVGRIYL